MVTSRKKKVVGFQLKNKNLGDLYSRKGFQGKCILDYKPAYKYGERIRHVGTTTDFIIKLFKQDLGTGCSLIFNYLLEYELEDEEEDIKVYLLLMLASQVSNSHLNKVAIVLTILANWE